MATQTVKVAISLPREEFEALEQVRKRLGISRSALISRALRSWLEDQGEEEPIRRYLEGYRREPETAEEIAEAAPLALQALGADEWEEE
jgi:metal-responsive CopG/Arc/MetJ family transcriptional regulator